MEEPMRCENCKWWDNSVQMDRAQPDTSGACRVNPPKVDKRTGGAIWPFTADLDWCGRWVIDPLSETEPSEKAGMAMYVLYGFLTVFIPYAIFFVIRNRQLAKSNAVGIEQKRVEREQQRWAAKAYRDYCRVNNLSIPLSTDEFYAGTEFWK